jgi:hypothetical protein
MRKIEISFTISMRVVVVRMKKRTLEVKNSCRFMK